MPTTDQTQHTNAGRELLSPSFLHQLNRCNIAATQLYPGSRMGARRSRSKGSGMEFANFRPYSAGDDFRAVDWMVYARTDHLYVKTFETEENLYVYILLDISNSMDFGSPVSKLELGKQLAGALGYMTLAQQDNLSIHVLNDRLRDSINTGEKGLRPSEMLNFCAQLQPGGKTDLVKSLQLFTVSASQRGMVFLISDFLSPGKFEDGLRYLVYHGFGVLGFHIMDPWEQNPKLEGEVDLEDSETGVTLPLTVRRNTCSQMQTCFRTHCHKIQGLFDTYAARYFPVYTSQSVERFVLEDLKREGVVV